MDVLSRPGPQLAALIGLCAVLLAPSLFGDFVWDDKRLIAESPSVADLSAIPGYFGANLQQSSGDAGRAAEGMDIYRPLYLTALTLLAQLGGDPLPFHVALLALHLLCAALLWLLVRRLVPDSRAGPAFAFVAFALHPVTLEGAFWISAISEPMATAALLGAVLLLLDDRALAAGLVFFAGLLSKEVIVMALPVLTLALIPSGVPVRRTLPLWVAAALMLILRTVALDGLQAGGGDQAQRMLAVGNLGLLCWHGLLALIAQRPVGPLHLFYEYEPIPRLVGPILGGLFVAFTAQITRRRRLLGVGIAVLASMLIPVALVTTVPTWGGFGRYLYAPLAFVLVGVVSVAPRGRASALFAVGWLALSLANLPAALQAYSGPIGLAEASLRLQPDAPIGHEWMGEALVDEGLVKQSIPHLARAVELAPEQRRPRINLAASLVAAGRPAEALVHVDEHERRFAPGPRSAFLRARALLILGRTDEAAVVLLDALERAPNEPNLTWLALGLLNNHPQPEAYRAWLRAELPSRPAAAKVLEPLLSP